MSEHCHHHHHDGEECHCHDHEHHHEPTSLEQAGGCAVGLTGTLNCWNADAEARFAKALMTVGKWVEKEAGMLLGHIKAAITLDDGTGLTLNLTDIESGVEHHGVLEPQEKVHFTFMCAVLDVEEHELRHRMFHAVDDSGLDYELDEHVECSCGHHHDHGHHHHDHEHGECHCHEHGHHHHHHDGECHCHDHEHGHDHVSGTDDKEPKKKSLWDRIRRNK